MDRCPKIPAGISDAGLDREAAQAVGQRDGRESVYPTRGSDRTPRSARRAAARVRQSIARRVKPRTPSAANAAKETAIPSVTHPDARWGIEVSAPRMPSLT